jgi:type VI secretion system protein ImpM
MSEQRNTGIYGKIPAHGDFLNHNLPRHFLDSWDHWLQQSILASQEVLAEKWLEYFLISPVWRFVLPARMLDEHSWAGILLPSVDKVGRYYPLSLIARVPPDVGVCEFMLHGKNWFESLENVAMTALEEGIDITALTEALNCCAFPEFGAAYADSLKTQHMSQFVLPLQAFSDAAEAGPIAAVLPLLCDALLRTQPANVSLWWTEGGEHVGSALLLADKFPRPTSFTAMLNGQWQHWHWPDLLHARTA